MTFFEQDLIRDELEQMQNLYEEIRIVMFSPDNQTRQSKLECLDKLSRLVELQELLYFRAKYSDDKEATEFTEMLRESAVFLGVSPNIDISQIFSHMREDIEKAKSRLDEAI
jgi:GTPase Era involved in 16S rRNA processing